MRYVFISDVHGQYDLMINALKEVSFDAASDTLVTLGDMFDRGSQSKEVLEYIMSVPNRISILGNHEDRLKEVLLGRSPNFYDNKNGMRETFQSFCGLPKRPSLYWVIQVFRTDSKFRKLRQKLWDYLDSCVKAIEFTDLIATHAWLPFHIEYGSCEEDNRYYLNKEWRTANNWHDAMWSNSQKLLLNGCFPDKNMIVGHWHAWRIAELLGFNVTQKVGKKLFIDCDRITCNCGKNPPIEITFIDGCANYPNGGKVNAYVYENNDPIIFYN